MSLAEYLVGALFCALVWGAALAIGVIVRRRLYAPLRGAQAVLAIAVVAYATLVGLHVLPGLVGLLTREAVALLAGVIALAGWRFIPSRPLRTAPEAQPPPSPGWSRLLAGAALAAVAVPLLAVLLQNSALTPSNFDWRAYQLPGIATWMDERSILAFTANLPGYATGSYPNTADVTILAAILPWSNAAFARILVAPLLALVGIGAYALARELGTRRSTAALLAALLLAVFNVWVPAVLNVKPDTFMLAMFGAAIVFGVRHTRTGATGDLVLAATALGLAFGSRWYGVSVAVVVLVVWAALQIGARVGVRAVLARFSLVSMVTLAVGGVWFLRNAIATGNPLFPVKVEFLGVTVFDAPRDLLLERFGHSVGEYLTDWEVVADVIFPAFRIALGPPALLLALGAGAALVWAALALRRGRLAEPRRAVVALGLSLAGGGIGIAYLITPASAQGPPGAPLLGLVGTNSRWLVPGLLLAAGATAWLLTRLSRGPRKAAELTLLAGVIGGAHFIDAPIRWLGVAAVALGAALLAAPLTRRALRATSRPATAVAALAIAALVLLAGQVQQTRFNRIVPAPDRPELEYLRSAAPAGSRVGMAGNPVGSMPIALAYGADFANEVEWVGPLVDGQRRNYATPRALRRALTEGDYDFLLVFRGAGPIWEVPPDGEQRIAARLPVERWATRAGYRAYLDSAESALFKRGAVRPATDG